MSVFLHVSHKLNVYCVFGNVLRLCQMTNLDQINQIDAYFVQIWHDLGMRPRGENYCSITNRMYFPYFKTPP